MSEEMEVKGRNVESVQGVSVHSPTAQNQVQFKVQCLANGHFNMLRAREN